MPADYTPVNDPQSETSLLEEDGVIDLIEHHYEDHSETSLSKKDKDKHTQTPLMAWIIHRKSKPIPNELLYDGYKTDRNKHGRTPLMLWIKHRPSEDIPNELLYDGYKTDRDKHNQTPLMF